MRYVSGTALSASRGNDAVHGVVAQEGRIGRRLFWWCSWGGGGTGLAKSLIARSRVLGKKPPVMAWCATKGVWSAPRGFVRCVADAHRRAGIAIVSSIARLLSCTLQVTGRVGNRAAALPRALFLALGVRVVNGAWLWSA